MNWFELMNLVANEYAVSQRPGAINELLDGQLFETPTHYCKHMIETEKSHRSAVDAACIEFAETGKWPLVQTEQTLLIWDRLKQARDLAQTMGLMNPSDTCFEGVAKSDIWKELLVKYWHRIGCEIYIGQKTARAFGC